MLCQLQLRIGKGAYAIVYRGTLEGTPLALKKMRLHNDEDEKMAANEISLLRLLGTHDRIVHLRAAYFEANV